MLESLRVRPQIRSRIGAGPLAEHVDAFVAVLQDEGYAPGVMRRYVYAIDVFGQWLARRQIAASDLDETIVARFVARLKRPHAPGRPRGRLPDVACGVRKFTARLWSAGDATRHNAPPVTPTDQWLHAFDEHLARVVGASVGTRRIYLRHARAFLTARFGQARPDWAALTTEDVADFVRVHASRLAPAACRAPATAIRAFLRFLATRGVVRAGLAGAIPPVREWKLARLPRALTRDDLQRVLDACRAPSPAQARDRVVLLVLARLGLRASEVAALHVEDVDWREGHVVIRAGKSGRERCLPLPHDVGDGLVGYLRTRRAAPGCRHLFVRARPPYGPMASATVTAIAQQALQHAGITVPRPGAHTFRHTVATHLVQQGVPFKAVADVLGHARLETTAIYAKLDLPTLAPIALPWPGAAP